MASRYVVIEHKDGRQCAVLPADYHKHYEPEGGWKVLGYEDGAEYETPAEARERRERERAAKAEADAAEAEPKAGGAKRAAKGDEA
jgi:hypothetical protein